MAGPIQRMKGKSSYRLRTEFPYLMNRRWPQILRLAQERKVLLLFGDEASFPQWSTLTYTWARRGQQPKVKTAGKRKGYKVFGTSLPAGTGSGTKMRCCVQAVGFWGCATVDRLFLVEKNLVFWLTI